jgi:hypothetical protein
MSMSTRLAVPIAAGAVCAAIMAGPALAQSPTEHPAPGVLPGKCADTSPPASSFTRRAARRAGRMRLVRGVASDVGCGLDRVEVAVSRKRGRRCRNLTPKGKLGRRTSCAHRRWLPAAGTTSWSFRLPRRLRKGTYAVRTRALDFAGNVGRAHGRRIKLR